MTNKKSGWAGKVKVALAIVCTVITSALIVQCNSKFEEPVMIGSETGGDKDLMGEINLPVLPDRKDPIKVDLTDALYFDISKNKLEVNGMAYKIQEIVPLLEKGNYPQPVTIVMKVDKDQTMDFVRDVQTELRKADQRRILYLGKTMDGAKIETPLLLPPTPENAAKHGAPLEPDVMELEAAGKIDLLKIIPGKQGGEVSQQKVYDFVKDHMKKQSADYVVSFSFDDSNTYNEYLLNLVHIKDGFNQIYQERAQEMFEKSLYDLNQEELGEVRAGIPMAISIAEKN